jgi:hypothetical protein
MDENRTGSFPPHRTEERLVRAVSDAVKQSYANPDRLDCPGSEAIQAVVVRRFSHPNFDDTVDHIAMCAPCLEDYNRRRDTCRSQRHSRWAAALAALLVLGLLWTYLRLEHRPKSEVAKKTPTPVVAATLNYSDWTAERSASPSPSKRETPRLARARLAVTLLLPIGTEDGSYKVQIRSAAGEIVARASGTAAWTGAAEELKISLDLTPIPAGTYMIAIQSAEGSQRNYPVLLE